MSLKIKFMLYGFTMCVRFYIFTYRVDLLFKTYFLKLFIIIILDINLINPMNNYKNIFLIFGSSFFLYDYLHNNY